MKLKFYMRGIGIAMIVTALLVGFSYRNDEKGMTDEEVITRAKELGMIENHFLNPTDSPDVSENEIQPEVSAEPEVSPEPEVSAEPEVSPEPEVSAEPEETLQDSVRSEVVMFEIKRGDSSDSVSRRLAEAGLVAEAKAYDRYLCEQGYDKRISVGIFEIPVGTSEADIALIITKQK